MIRGDRSMSKTRKMTIQILIWCRKFTPWHTLGGEQFWPNERVHKHRTIRVDGRQPSRLTLHANLFCGWAPSKIGAEELCRKYNAQMNDWVSKGLSHSFISGLIIGRPFPESSCVIRSSDNCSYVPSTERFWRMRIRINGALWIIIIVLYFALASHKKYSWSLWQISRPPLSDLIRRCLFVLALVLFVNNNNRPLFGLVCASFAVDRSPNRMVTCLWG